MFLLNKILLFKRLLILGVVLIASPNIAFAQTCIGTPPLTQIVVDNTIDICLPTNNANEISALALRQTLQTMTSAIFQGTVGSVTISGTPSVGYIPIATSSTTAMWSSFNLNVAGTSIIGGVNGNCLYDNVGFLGTKSCGGGVTSGAATSGCSTGALVYTDPTTANVRCDNTTVTNGFFGLGLSLGSLSAVQILAANLQTSAIIGTGAAPDFAAGTCAATVIYATSLSGKFSANGACGGGTIVITFPITANHGYNCQATNRTNASRILSQIDPDTISTATLSGTLNSGDIISYICLGD